MDNLNLYIDGQIVPPTRGNYFDSLNPANGEILAKVADGSEDDMVRAIIAARQAFDNGRWSGLTANARGKYLKRVAQLIRKNSRTLARLESLDTGKTLKQTTYIDVPTCAETFENFSNVDALLQPRKNSVNAPVKSLTAHEPMGVVGCIIPWNYPLIMFAWKVAPALAAGNTVVFKPSSQASVAILKLAEIIQAALPAGVLNIVSSRQHAVTAMLVKSRHVDMISFTGGTQTGRQIMRLASEGPKKVSLELGGKSPNIVFADCDLEAAVGGTLSAIFMNQGQMCVAGSRLLLEDKIYDEFLARLVTAAKGFRIGDTSDFKTDFGPLVSEEQREKVLEYINIGIQEGAKLICGGKVPLLDGKLQKGFFLEPTIFADVTNDMTIARQEIFGPVLAVIKFSTMQEALEIANNTEYGLAACVWTKDKAKAGLAARQLRCGTVWVNTYGGFYDQAPFGGYKMSGIGRELGPEGLLEYMQAKHICCDTTPGGKALVTRWFGSMNYRTILVFLVTNVIKGIKKSFNKW